ncbi:hypothetical protein PHLGIDRAFT_181952 [Phlebiopsis gigantea 11061_1 CR5-6]|uniref:Uncharacterized protein n=1 Tax=Phlebiopsis gigantea (strain 11061_1 CR5-6) TaxID=745531 RepID=A0A0C3S7I6_PHLG1|nr:hypothetical protein PHLGIDRAFT_181952 [Phlebiopsis gigantea 11061_1 CR5-6]
MPAERSGRTTLNQALRKKNTPSGVAGSPSPPSPSSTSEPVGKYLFPLEPKRTKLVKFRSEESLTQIYEAWSSADYDRKAEERFLPGYLPGHMSSPSDDDINLDSSPVKAPLPPRPRLTRTHAHRRWSPAGHPYPRPNVEPTRADDVDDSIATASTVLLTAMQTGDWPKVEKLSTICTDTSQTEYSIDEDSRAEFEHFFYNPGSDDEPWASESPTDTTPSPRTPSDEMALLVGDGPTVRYVPPSANDKDDEPLPLEGQGTLAAEMGPDDFQADSDDEEVLSSMTELHLERAAESSTSAAASGTALRRWPSSLSERAPSRLFARRHRVPQPEPEYVTDPSHPFYIRSMDPNRNPWLRSESDGYAEMEHVSRDEPENYELY